MMLTFKFNLATPYYVQNTVVVFMCAPIALRTVAVSMKLIKKREREIICKRKKSWEFILKLNNKRLIE